MAEKADGSIIIDTKIDTSGAEKGAQEVGGAVDDAVGGFKKLGQQMNASLQKTVALLSDISESLNRMYGKTEENSARMKESSELTAEALEAQAQAMSVASAGAGKMRGNMNALEKQAASLAASMQNVSRSAEAGFASGKAVLTFERKLHGLDEKLQSLKQGVQQFGEQKIQNEDYEWLSQAIGKTEKELEKLIERQEKMENTGVRSNSKSWKNLQYDIDQARVRLKTYRDEISQLEESGGAFVRNADTQEFSDLQRMVSEIEKTLRQNKALIDSEAVAQARLNVLTAQEQVINAQNAEERKKAVGNLTAAQNELKKTANAQVAVVETKGIRKSIQDITGLSSAMALLKNGAIKAAGTLMKLPFRAVSSGIKTASVRLKSFRKETGNTQTAANMLVHSLFSLKNMLLSRIKESFITKIFNQAKESLGTLAKFSDEFNDSMSAIQNSSKETSGNLAVSIGNLIMAVEPAITSLVDALSKGIAYFNAFFASMQGKSTVTVAKKQMESYRDSLDSAAKKAKKLNRELYSFDEITKQGDTASEKKQENGTDLFEEIPIKDLLPKQVQDYFALLKAAIKGGEWEELGNLLADGLNTVMKKADNFINEQFRPAGVMWALAIAGIVNGIISELDWTLAGKTIADGLNSIADIINTWLVSVDFDGLGTGIGESINGLFDFVEWDLLGRTFGNGFNGFIDTIYGIVSTTDFKEIGASFAEFVNNFGSTLELEKAADMTALSLNGIKDTVQEFIDGTEWEEAGMGVAESFNRLFSGVDWPGIGVMLVDGFNSAVGFLGTAVETADFGEAGQQLAKTLSEMIKEIDWTQVGKGISSLVVAMLNFLIEFIQNADWGGAAKSLVSGLLSMLQSIDIIQIAAKLESIFFSLYKIVFQLITGALSGLADFFAKTFKQMGLDGIAGLFEGISRALDNVSAWVKAHIFDPVVNAVKDFFGIHSPSTVFAEIGGYIIQGLFEGMGNIGQSVKEWAGNFLSGVKDVLGIHSPSRLFRDAVGKYIGLGISEGMEESEGSILASAASIAADISSELNKEDMAVNPALEMTDGLGSILDHFSSRVEGSFTELIRRLQEITHGADFSFPQMAKGNIMPYQVNASVESSGTMSLSGMDGILGKLETIITIGDALLNELGENQGQEDSGTQDINLYIDGKKVTDVVIKRINRITRSTGDSPLVVV